MRPRSNMPVTGGASPVRHAVRSLPIPPGKRLYDLVQKVVRQRTYLVKHRLSQLPADEVRTALMKLETWLEQNPHAGPIALERFRLKSEVRFLIPGNEAGHSLLTELNDLITS